ncbi:2Fe-2S iron-sulfur cluster-binding protein [Massilia sp. DJPM01]|uniref:2Fe-2S iron-sulfur cluster-binding protein n=1 Tax=Massilia sp. DJPM01 TaxID=3024404 RepID=UPI00259DEE5D|nr:2Fe-2S iron-sulfur cluster-binding protein [Massilia sp. DJPM01]MDM5179225.1 2Fe-2S iron-sulfur cluster-binding protein [Massilia sp. DJPM01]
MGRAFSDITFTPTVRAMQTRMGSRAQYAGFDTSSDPHNRLRAQEVAFITSRDHFYQATVSETGWPYVQHRGGPAGFLKVLDERTIGFADFSGNVQYISVGNLQTDDRISMILMDYAEQVRLKLIGRVRLVDVDENPELVARVRDPGYSGRVERAFIIHIEGYDWNCPQHITARFTQDEIVTMTAPLQAQVKRLKEAASMAAKPVLDAVLGNGKLALIVTGMRQLTPSIRAYQLRSSDGSVLPQSTAGAHLSLPVQFPDGTCSIRSYSIASDPNSRDVIEIAVLREDAGSGGSAAVHDTFRLGLRLNCGLPRNDFPLVEDAAPIVLIAGGIGITPIRAMVHALLAQCRPFELHYAARSRGEAAYADELQLLLGDRLHLYPSDETRLDLDELLATAPLAAAFYACGPARMIDAMVLAASRVGVASGRVHLERFAAASARSDDKPVLVTLSRSARQLTVPSGQSILDVIQAAGVNAPASCRIGNCGVCAVRVLAGTPDHRDGALSEQQRNAGSMCICVSRAVGDSLTLDL